MKIDGVQIRELKLHEDSRGSLTELFRRDELPNILRPDMGYVSITKPGIGRGPHEHRWQTDIFAFIGPGTFRVSLWDARIGSSTLGAHFVFEAGVNRPVLAIVPSGIVHGYRNVSDVNGMVLNFPNQLYAGWGKNNPVDEIRHEDDRLNKYVLE